MSLVVHKLMLNPATSGGNGSLQAQPSAAITATTINNNNVSSVVGAGVAHFSNTTITSLTKAIGTTSTTIINAVPGSTISAGIDGTATGANCTVNITPGHVHHSVLTPVSQLHTPQQQQQFHYPSPNNTTSMAVTVSAHTANRLPYQYTKLVHQSASSPTATTQGMVQQQHHTVLQQIPVTTIHHNFNNVGQQQQQHHHHQFKGPQQTAIVTQSRQVALHAYSNQRLVNPSGNGGTNSEGSSGEPPPPHPPPPKCYVSSQYVKNNSTAGGTSYNTNGGGAPSSMITSVISSTATKSPIVPNEGRKAYLPLVLQDHNYMAAFPTSSSVTTTSSSSTTSNSNSVVANNNNPNASLTSKYSNTNNNVVGGAGKLIPGTGSPVRSAPLAPGSPSHHQSSPTASVIHHHHQSPSRTYSLSSKSGKGGSGPAMLASSLATSVTSNVITNPGSRSIVQQQHHHGSKLSPSSPHNATRSPKAITYSLPRQARFATTVTSPLQQHGGGAQVIQQQQHFGSPVKSGVKSAGVGTVTHNSVHRSVGVIQGGGGNNKTVTTSTLFTGQGGGGEPSPAHLQNHQRYTYRRSTSTVSSGGGVPHHSPIITSILSPATHPAPIQTTQPSQVPLAGLQQYHNNNTNNNRSYVYATSTTAFVPGASNTNNSVNIISGANPNILPGDGSYNSNNNTNNNVIHTQASSAGVLMSTNNVSGGGTNNNVNILINNKTGVINKVSGSNNFITSGSSRNSPSSLIVPTGPAAGARGPSTPPCITYIPSPHIPPPPGVGPAAVSSHQPMSDLDSSTGASHLSTTGATTASVLNTSSRKDSSSSSLLSSQQHLARNNNNNKGNNKRDASNTNKGREEQAASNSSSSSDDEKSSSPGPSGEETETAPEGEGDDMEQEDSITRCVCDLTHDDGYMIQCDRCQVWQHVICMELSKDNIPDEYLCEACSPRPVNKLKARSIQLRKRAELAQIANMMSSSDSEDNSTQNSKNKPGSKGSTTNIGSKKKKVKIVSRSGGGLSRPGGGLPRPAGGLPRPGGGGIHSTVPGGKTKNPNSTPKNGGSGGTNNKKKVSRKASGGSGCGGGSTLVHINNNNNNLSPIGDDKEKKPIIKTRRRKSSSSASTANIINSPDILLSSTALSSIHSSSLVPTCFPLSSPTPSSIGAAGTPQQQLTYSDVVRGWVEGYEAAITNHYSPELRARVHAARINGISPHLRASVQGAVLGHRCKVVDNTDQDCLEFEKKVLVAGCAVSSGTALLEYQGKYLLWSQWCSNNGATNTSKNNLTNASTTTTVTTTNNNNNNNSGPVTNPCTTNIGSAGGNSPPADKASADRFLPFTLRYTLLQEGLSVAVDARTYGNEARFARRSCTPNAQVRHVVERGSLHLYIVATEDIEEGGEILLPLHTCNTTDPAQLPPCPASDHQTVCPHVNTKRPQGNLLGKGPSTDTGAIEEKEEPDKTASTPSTPTMKQQRITSPMSSPESSSLSPVSSPHSPLLSPKGSKSPSKMNLTSPLRSPSKVNVSPFSASGLLSTPRRLTSPVSSAAKKDRSPDQMQQTSPERENMKCHSYSKRTLTSLPIPLHQLRNCRRSISESCSRPSRISINTTNAASSSEEEDDEDDEKEPILVASKTSDKSSKGATATRRSSDDGPGGSFAPVHQISSFVKKRTISVDSRSFGSRKNCDGSATGSVASLGSSVAGVTTIGPPSVRLRNNSTSSSKGGTMPKSPCKASLNRSPSDTEGGGEGNESSGGGSFKENRRKRCEDQQDSKKMTREEKKIAAYMKAFELMEKRSQRKQEMVKKKVEDRVKGKKSDDDEDNSSGDETFRPHDKHRKKNKKSMRNNSRGQPCSFKKGSHRRRTTSGPPDDTSGKFGSCSSYCAPGAMETDVPATEYGGASPMASHTRFPKTKKSMMNDWLSECVDSDSNAPSALSLTSCGSGLSSGVGVPSHYMRAAPPTRRSSSCAAIAGLSSSSSGGGGGSAVASAGGVSAKKRWLRQAISEEPTATCPVAAGGTSPTHAPDSPPGGDYTTPLKKRRLARESVSGENSNSCDIAQQQQAVEVASTAQEMVSPTAAPDAEVKMELDDDMKVKKEEGDLKYEAASNKATSLSVAAAATAGVKIEPITPKNEVEEEKPVVILKCCPVEIVSATAKEDLTAAVPAWNELGRLTRKRKRSVENLMAKVNGDQKLLVSHQTSSCSEGGGKGRNCDFRSEECVVNTDECVDTPAIENDGDVNIKVDCNRKVDWDVGDENSDGGSSERSVPTRRDRAKKKLDVQRDDTGNKKVYRNKKSCVRYGSDMIDKSRKRGRPRKCVSSDNEGMETIEGKRDEGMGTRRTKCNEQVSGDDSAGSNLAEEADVVVDDDDSQESGFEGFSEHTSSQHGSSSEVDVEGDSEDEKQQPSNMPLVPEKGVTSEDKKTSNLGSTFLDELIDETFKEIPSTSSDIKDVGVRHDFDMDCEVQIDDYTPDEAQGNDTTQANNDKCFAVNDYLCQSADVVNDQAAGGCHTEEESMEKNAEWRGAGPRTPEGPAPSSPERRACPRTPSDTPPVSPTPPSPASSPPPPPPPPDSLPPLPSESPSPRSPLPSILQDDSLAGPSITTLGRTPLTTLGCTTVRDHTSSHCVSGGSTLSSFGSPITTLASGSSLTTFGAPVSSLTENPLHHSTLSDSGGKHSTHSRPPLTNLGSHESVLPLTTLGSLDDSDLSLGSLRSKYALGGEDSGKKFSEAAGLYDQLANPSKIPMPVKRKLSILEYRKRKSVNSESDASNSPSNGSSGSAATINRGSTSTSTGDNAANSNVNNRQTYEALDGEAFPTLSSGAIRARSSSVESNESDCNQTRLSSSNLVKGSRTSRSPILANVFSRSPSPAMSPLTISSSTACYLSQSGVSGEKLLSEACKSVLCADSDDDEEEYEEEQELEEELEEEELEEGELAGEQDDEEEEEVAMSCGLSPSGSPPSPPSPGTPPGTPPTPRQAPTPPPHPPPMSVHSPDSPPSPTSSHSPFSSPPPFTSPPNVRVGDYSSIDTADLAESVSTYRGTLTDRLKREFGLNVSEEDSDCSNLTALGIGSSSSRSITTKDVSVPPPAIPIQRSSSGAPLPVPPPAVHLQNPSLSATAVGFPAPDSLSTQSSNLITETPFPKKFKTDNPNNFSEQRSQYYSSLPPR